MTTLIIIAIILGLAAAGYWLGARPWLAKRAAKRAPAPVQEKPATEIPVRPVGPSIEVKRPTTPAIQVPGLEKPVVLAPPSPSVLGPKVTDPQKPPVVAPSSRWDYHPRGLASVTPPPAFEEHRPLECKTEWRELPIREYAENVKGMAGLGSKDMQVQLRNEIDGYIARWAAQFRPDWAPEGLEINVRGNEYRVIHPVTRFHLRDEELNQGLEPGTL